MRILFTKLRHIGDNLLVTPIITATRRKFPGAEIWVAVRRGTEGILAGCPEIDRILVTARPEQGGRTWVDFREDLATFAKIARTKFDYAFELGTTTAGECWCWHPAPPCGPRTGAITGWVRFGAAVSRTS